MTFPIPRPERSILLLAGLLPMLMGAGQCSDGTSKPLARCIDAKLVAAVRHADDTLGCHVDATLDGATVDATCLQTADARFFDGFANAELEGGCETNGDADRVLSMSQILVSRALIDLVPEPGVPSRCTARKLAAGATRVRKSGRAHGFAVVGRRKNVAGAMETVNRRFERSFLEAEAKDDCQTLGDLETAAARFDSGLDAIYGELGVVDAETLHTASPAQPAETPGTPGYDAAPYPLLALQLGLDADLNNATYTRYFHRGAFTQPDAVLILVPGFEGGGATFDMLAVNLVSRALEEGSTFEVWAYDRRGNQLEDREGVAISLAEGDPTIALDWFYGDELGLTLDPALAAGPGRRAVFHDTQADTAFMANWTSLLFSRDIDAIVELARAHAKNGNVFLGGHSAGTGFTARYAATDFDLSGAGPADPGYAKLRGLVLLEGGGGSLGGPLSEDQLDRIEDRADGGLFHAVRDDAPRCVDGTPCTPATEAVDCAGIGNATCTPPTEAYAVIPGLLNPRVLAASEPGAVQGLDDPDSGQVIIQVDQGGPGNSAVGKVPDLSLLGFLPKATAAGALGTFIDDDGIVGSLATFVQTSVGAPGPVQGGILSWLELHEGPMPAAVVPDNGPPPVSLPAGPWGQEVEVTRLDRMTRTFVSAGTNFTDWYYPSAGQSTTSGIGLDSTQLSVGRGRRDIENLTQSMNVDIPVIAFGGTNGLTPVPARFLAYAQSIGPCQSASCTGTPRVVDPASPNPAFPTFGDVDGGYEIHLTEGVAHVDIVTAEDDADNAVIGPLLDFLRRNVQ